MNGGLAICVSLFVLIVVALLIYDYRRMRK